MSSTRSLVVALIAIASCASFASGVEAQEEDTDARRTFDEAARQFDASNYALALQSFTEVYEQLTAAGHARAGYVLYNIGRCNEELGRMVAARDAFARYLTETGEEAPYRVEVSDRVQDLQARIDAQPSDARGEVQAPAGPPNGGSLSWIGWALAGLGGASAISGVITGVMALDRRDQLEARCPGFVCPDASDQALIDEADGLAIATDVLLVGGLVVATAGVVLALLLDASPESTTPTAGCSSEGCQFGVTGRF